MDTAACWVRKTDIGYKQPTVIDSNGLALAVETTAANCHDSKPLLDLLDKAAKHTPLTHRQLQRNHLVTKARYVVERTFGSQAHGFNAKILRYRGLCLSACLAHAPGNGV